MPDKRPPFGLAPRPAPCYNPPMSEISRVRVYAILPDGGFWYEEAALSDARRQKMAQMRNPEGKALSAAADMALSYALSQNVPGYGPPPDLSYDDRGRPQIPGAFVSITHTRGLAACAISERPVGLDAEWERPMGDKIAGRMLAPLEMAAFAQSKDQNEFLLLKWTAKEAFLKLTGEGIPGGMYKYAESNHVILDPEYKPRAFVARHALPGYFIAVCQSAPFTSELIIIPAEQLRMPTE